MTSLASRSPPRPTARHGTVVVALGNPSLADDGLGMEVLGRLARAYDCGADVDLEDGGTWGVNLLPLLEQAERVLFVDAIRTGKPPGTIVRVAGADLPRTLGLTLSPHQVDLQEVVAEANHRGTFPPEAVAIGVEPGTASTRAGLSDVVSGRLDDVLDAVVSQLRDWGHEVQVRPYRTKAPPFPQPARHPDEGVRRITESPP